MTQREKEQLNEIRKHLGELHEKWSNNIKNGEEYGHCKSNEGYVGLLYRFPNWFECDDKESYINAKPKLDMIEIYSYLFGRNRLHTFDSIDEAYKEVMTWNY